MAQYYPTHRARKYHEINRKINEEEYREVVDLVEKLGIENGWVQDLESSENYLPDFNEKAPFESKKDARLKEREQRKKERRK
jgi:putative pyruvate formate lyase activating enzyme